MAPLLCNWPKFPSASQTLTAGYSLICEIGCKLPVSNDYLVVLELAAFKAGVILRCLTLLNIVRTFHLGKVSTYQKANRILFSDFCRVNHSLVRSV